MRIGMLADVYKPYISGVTHFIDLNKKYLEAAGHEVYVFTFGHDDSEEKENNVIRSAGLPIGKNITTVEVQLNLRYDQRARQLLRTMDIAHVHHPFISGTLALRYCKPFNIPVVFTNHTRYDLTYQTYLPLLPEAIGDTLLHAFLPSFCKSCDLVIAPSEGMRDIMQEFGVTTPIDVLPNGVDIAPIKSVDEPMSRANLGFTTEDIVMVFVGRLGPEKDIPFMLRAFGGLHEAYPNVRLLLIGHGPDKENLEDRVQHMGIRHAVCFAGQIPYKDVPRYLAMSDIFLITSTGEGHPLTIIEAMAAGLPTMGVRTSGVSDTVVEGETGFLAKKDLAAFTAKLGRLVTETELRNHMSETSKAAAEHYAIERTSQLLLEHYENVIADKHGRGVSFGDRARRFIAQIRP